VKKSKGTRTIHTSRMRTDAGQQQGRCRAAAARQGQVLDEPG